jgi:putative transposase
LRSIASRNVLVKILGEVRDLYRFALVGYVIMPEHIHLLISEPPKGTPSTILQVFKQRVSRRLRRKPRRRSSVAQLRFRFDSSDHGLPQFWQPRFYDFNVWSQKKITEKLHDMHRNPVKRKLVAHPKDWPWSRFVSYTNKDSALLHIDPFGG